jgi:hypothetical protein
LNERKSIKPNYLKMKKIVLNIIMFCVTFIGYSQVINVNTTTYTVPQLVTDVLFGSGTGGGACAGTVSNITWSTGTNFGGPNGIGYFTNTNPIFPLNSWCSFSYRKCSSSSWTEYNKSK